MSGWPITYGDLMERDFSRLFADSGLAQAAGMMLERRLDLLPVLEKETGAPLGLIRRDAVLYAVSVGASPDSAIAPLVEPLGAVVSPVDRPCSSALKNDLILVGYEGRAVGVFYPRGGPSHPQFLLAHPVVDLVLSAIPNPIVCIDEWGLTCLCNEAMRELFPGVDLMGKPLTEVIKNSKLADAMHAGVAERWQKLQIGERSFLVNRSPLMLNGKLLGALASLHEVSELEHISSELRSVRLLMEELDGIIECSYDGIYVTDGQGRTVRVNESYQNITGLRSEEVLGHTMYELVEKGVFDQSTTIRVLETGQPITLIQKIRDGERTVMASGIPLHDADGNISRVVTTVRDLTELNRLRDELSVVGNLKCLYEEELKELRRQISGKGDIVVHSPSMQSVLELALRLGSVDSTVLIQGESGAGKEVVAEVIQRNSLRKDKPFIKINCTAIPEALLESELFGYVRGAFTGANKEGKAGLFEEADGGTLLLDEIGDLPMPLQAKLLRVIQERRTRRIGDNTPRLIDVRLIAATHHDLTLLVQQKLFREDLFYRLNVVPIHVPPLRERKEDVLFMMQAFLDNFCARHDRKKELHPTVVPRLLDYHWPGNVRELENMMERLVVTSPGSIITVQDLPPVLRGNEQTSEAIFSEGGSLKDVLERVEEKVLRAALARHKTTRRVAEALGIDQSSVVRKAKRFGIGLGSAAVS